MGKLNNRGGSHAVRPHKNTSKKPKGGAKGSITRVHEARRSFIQAAHTSNPEKQIETATRFVGSRQSIAPIRLMDGGAMLLELANHSEVDEAQRLDFLGKAHETLQTAVACDLSTRKIQTLKAQLYLANMPIYQQFALGNNPGDDKLREAYQANLELTDRVTHFPEYIAEKISRSNELATLLAGTRAELAILALMQRDGLAIGEGDLMAVPSHFSEDHSLSVGGEINSSWDISNFAAISPDGNFDLVNKVQVKSSQVHRVAYAPDIAVVCPGTDLVLKPRGDQAAPSPNRTIPTRVILNELLEEAYGAAQYSHVSENIDRRTQQLVEIIG